jgi:acyl-CoA thioester hydrolase
VSTSAERGARVTELRVRYPETDRMDVAYHGHYLAWYEIGRTELMREAGCAYRDLEDRQGLFFPVIEVGSRYLQPARYDDALEVHTRLVKVGGARFRFEYELFRRGDRVLLATGFTEHAAVGRDGKPTRLPPELRARLLAHSVASRARS